MHLPSLCHAVGIYKKITVGNQIFIFFQKDSHNLHFKQFFSTLFFFLNKIFSFFIVQSEAMNKKGEIVFFFSRWCVSGAATTDLKKKKKKRLEEGWKRISKQSRPPYGEVQCVVLLAVY